MILQEQMTLRRGDRLWENAHHRGKSQQLVRLYPSPQKLFLIVFVCRLDPVGAHMGVLMGGRLNARIDAQMCVHKDVHVDVHMDVHVDVHMDAHMDVHMAVHVDANMDAHTGDQYGRPK